MSDGLFLLLNNANMWRANKVDNSFTKQCALPTRASRIWSHRDLHKVSTAVPSRWCFQEFLANNAAIYRLRIHQDKTKTAVPFWVGVIVAHQNQIIIANDLVVPTITVCAWRGATNLNDVQHIVTSNLHPTPPFPPTILGIGGGH